MTPKYPSRVVPLIYIFNYLSNISYWFFKEYTIIYDFPLNDGYLFWNRLCVQAWGKKEYLHCEGKYKGPKKELFFFLNIVGEQRRILLTIT